MPVEDARRIGENGEDDRAGRERRPTVEADRDVNAPIPDSAETQALRDATYRYNQARDALNALTAGLTDANGNLDYSRADPLQQYQVLPEAPPAVYDGFDVPLEPRADAIEQAAHDGGIEMRDARQQMIDQNKRDMASALDEYNRRKADLSKAAADAAAADRSAKAKVAAAVLKLIGVAGLVASAVLAYLLVQANKTKPGEDAATAFGVTDDTVTGFVPGQVAKIRVLANDTGVDAATLAIVGADASGVLKVDGEGSWSVDADQVVFTPEAGFKTDPTPQKYSVSAAAATDANGAKRSGQGTVTLRYNGDFDVPSIVLTTYVHGQNSLPIKFLEEAVGVDASKSELVDADSGNALQKTVAGEGVWTMDITAKTLTFTVGQDAGGATFAKDPTPVKFKAVSTDGARSVERSVILIDTAPEVPDISQKADFGKAFTVSNITVGSIVFDQASIQILDANGAAQNPLVVDGEGSWSIDAAGVISFTPEAGFKDLPAAIKATIADAAGRRSNSFSITAIPFAPPLAVSEIVEPLDYTNPQNPVPITIGQGTPATVRTRNNRNDIAGDFDIDRTSVQIVGLMPFDGAIPSASFETPGKVLNVQGEGTWTVNATNGNISLRTEANFVRWPTPLAYTVADVKGHRSNIGFIWITPDGQTVRQGQFGANAKSDADFWTDLSGNVLKKQYSLSEVLQICAVLERLTRSGLDRATAARLNAKPIVSDADLLSATRAFVITNSASAPSLEPVTAFVDNAYLNAQDAGLGNVPLATRITRLRLIQSILRTDLEG